MSNKIRGITIEIGGDTQPLQKALADVNKSSKDLQTELKQVEKLLKLDPKNTELLTQKQQILGNAIETTREKLERLKSAQEQVNEQFKRGEITAEQYRAFQREVEITEKKLRDLEKSAGIAQKSLADIGESLQKSGDKMSKVGAKLTKNVTAPIVAVGTTATAASIQFESAFAGVKKTVDATDEELETLRQGIRDMAKEIPAAATEIAAVAEAAGQLGIETPNILKFTETMIGLGEATNLTAEEGATQFARFANIVGMSQGDFDRLGSSVVALGKSCCPVTEKSVA